FPERAKVDRRVFHRPSSKNESEDHDRFSISALCHVLLHPIALPITRVRLEITGPFGHVYGLSRRVARTGISRLTGFEDSAPNGFRHAGAGPGSPEKDELTDLRP